MNRNLIILSLTGLIAVSCNRFDAVDRVFDNSIYLDVSSTDQTQITNFGNRIESATKELSVLLAYPAGNDITATVSVDETLVSEYNGKNGTSYELLPSQYLDFSGQTVTIEAGKTQSETVTIGFKGLMGEGDDQTGALEIDKTYLLPVSVTSGDMQSMDGSSVAYYLVKRTSAITNAAQLNDNWINFPKMDEPGEIADVYNNLTAVTYEALINIDEFLTTYNQSDGSSLEVNVTTVMGVEQYLLLRIGDTNFERQQLQFDGSGNGSQFGKIPAKGDASKKLVEGQWYHVACTYDQSTRVARIYLNGKLLDEAKDVGVTGSSADNRITLAMRALNMPEAYQFFIGRSYNDGRPLYGKISEARVWSVARTEQEIWDNMYRIENPETIPELIGYWKFDEGEGNVIHDYSKYGNDGQAQNDIVWPSGIEIPEINKTE